MKKITLIFGFISAILFSQKNYLDTNHIEVSGTSEILVEPDEIYLGITIKDSDLKKGESLESKESQMIQELKKLGIDTFTSLQVNNLGGEFQEFFLKKNETQIFKKYILKLESASSTNKVLPMLKNLNISTVSLLKTSHSKENEYKLLAKTQAIQVAKNKAIEILKAIDEKCGKALFVDESPTYRSPSSNSIYSVDVNELDAKYSQLSFEKIRYKSTIEAIFEIIH